MNLSGTVVFEKYKAQRFPILINTADACKCNETYYFTTDSILPIEIITLNDFDSSHFSGSDVTEYFKVPDYDYSNSKTKVVQKPIDSFFQYSYSNYAPGFYLKIFLNQSLKNKGYSQFQVKVTCKNGKEFETETKRVYLF